jgi:gluconate 5-dehydrogenase
VAPFAHAGAVTIESAHRFSGRQHEHPIRQLFDLSGQDRARDRRIARARPADRRGVGEAGARVLLTSRKAGDLEESAAHLKAKDIEADLGRADLSQPSEIVRVTQDALARLGQVTSSSSTNAGAAWGAAAEDYPLEAWDR